MNPRITKFIISIGLVLFLSSCLFGIDDLSQDNTEYILNNYDTLIYLYNQTDTCKVSVDSYFRKGSVDYVYGFPSVEDDYGTSKFYLPDSIYQVSIGLKGKIDVIHINFLLLDKNRVSNGRDSEHFYHSIKKSELINKISILNTEYYNCFKYDSNTAPYPNYADIQNFVYNKEYGLVQLIMQDSTRFELIGAK